MSGGGSTVSRTEIDPQAKQFRGELFDRAREAADQPFQLFGGERFAPLNADQQAAIGQMRQNAGILGGGLESGVGAIEGGLNPDVRDVSSGSITDMNMARFMNPFTGAVIDSTLSDLDRARQMAIGDTEDAAIGAGAFGGSRHGVADSLTNEAFAEQAADAAARLRLGGFQNAQALAENELSRNMNAQQLNQGADLNREQLEQAAAGNLVNLGVSGSDLLARAGDVQQSQQQQERDFDFQEFMRRINEGTADVGLLTSVMSGVPVGKTTTNTVNPSTGAKLSQLAGLGLTGAMMAGTGGASAVAPTQVLGNFNPATGMFGAGSAFTGLPRQF